MKIKIIGTIIGIAALAASCQKEEIVPVGQQTNKEMTTKATIFGTSLSISSVDVLNAPEGGNTVTVGVTGFSSRPPKNINIRVTNAYKSCMYMKRADYCGTGDSSAINYYMNFQGGELAAGETYFLEVQDPVTGVYTTAYSFTIEG